MINFTSLPSSVARPLDVLLLTELNNQFTFTGFINEETLLADINKQLNKLETSNDVNKTVLESIIRLTEQIQAAHEEKEEVLTRIDWLKRLYKAKDEMESVDTKEKAKQIRNLIAPVQTCPMKNQLIAELDSLEQLLAEETIVASEPSKAQLLMEKSVEEVGKVFINLGKAGRQFVIAVVLKEFGDDSSVDNVKECAISLEQRVQCLSEVTERTEMVARLEKLPLPSFSTLVTSRKERVAELLIEKSDWDGLLSLDRRISQFDKDITKEEREKYESENTIKLQDGTVVALSLDERYREI